MEKTDIDNLVHTIEKNIERNCEENEDAITNRIDLLEQRLIEIIQNKVVNEIEKETEIETEINEDEDEETNGNGNGDDLRRSMSEKFDVSKTKTANPDTVMDKVTVVESVLIDTNMRMETLEKTVKTMGDKLNDLVKVNNAILKRLESGAQFSGKKNKMDIKGFV